MTYHFFMIQRMKDKASESNLLSEYAGLVSLWGYPRGDGHRSDRQARRRFNSD